MIELNLLNLMLKYMIYVIFASILVCDTQMKNNQLKRSQVHNNSSLYVYKWRI